MYKSKSSEVERKATAGYLAKVLRYISVQRLDPMVTRQISRRLTRLVASRDANDLPRQFLNLDLSNPKFRHYSPI